MTVDLPDRDVRLAGEQVLHVAHDLRHVEAAHRHFVAELGASAGPDTQ